MSDLRGLSLPDTTLDAERQWCLLARSVLRQYQQRHYVGMLREEPVPTRLWDAYDHLAAQLTEVLDAWPEEATHG